MPDDPSFFGKKAMDQGSSPNLPVGSLATNKFHNGSESLLIGKKLQSFDDSSSATSMSTTSRSTHCMACKEEESSVKRLVTCIICKRKIHGGCANPYVEDYKAPYTCTRCKKDQAQIAKKNLGAAFGESQNSTKFSTYTSPYARSHPAYPSSVTSEPAKDSTKITGMKPGVQCPFPGCINFVFSIQSGSHALCTKHRIEQQNALAKAAAPKPAAPVSRAFQKEKLYPMKPEDKQHLKRKRQTTKRSSNGSHQDMDQEAHTMFTFQASGKASNVGSKTPELVRILSTPTRPSPRSAIRKTLELKERQANITKSPEEVEKAVDDLNRSLGSASMAESPIDPISGLPGRLLSRLVSVRGALDVLGDDSPDYSPPALAVDDECPWTGIMDRSDSPGSQIAQELAATASQPDASEHNSSLDYDYGRAGLPSIDEEIAASHAHPYKSPQVRDEEDEDEEMLDPDSRALIDRLASEHPSSPAKSASPPAVRPLSSPSSSAYSANVSSQVDEQGLPADPSSVAALGARHELLIAANGDAPQPNSIEAKRAQRAANFDTTELDSFLFKQAQIESDDQPTSKELLNTQVWGHIDPRVAWPKKMTPEQVQEKIKEIEARGGKKANFGKILTAQVRKERADKGWNIHQTSERRSEEECKEMDRRLEELFGTEGLGNCVPGIRDGRLVMIEQLEPEEPQTGPGRRKKRREPKIYPVTGGQ